MSTLLFRSTALPVITLTAIVFAVEIQAGDPIAERMQAFADANQFSGSVTMVVHRGKLVHHAAVGLADVESGRAMQQDSLFAIASMTKPITATALMILQDDGRVSVEDPVAKYIPEFKDVSLADGPAKTEMTIRHLMTHTSGLGGEQRCIGSIKSTAEELATRKLSFDPGTKWQYSPGLNVIGRIIEVVSGQPYEAFLAERIFQPLRMVDTTFAPTEAQRARVARLYEPGENGESLAVASHWITDFSGEVVPSPSGGLFSTASDMAAFYRMILNGGQSNDRQIVSRSAVEQMTTVQTGDLVTGFTPGNGWGLGWCVVRQPQGVTKDVSPGTFGHGGRIWDTGLGRPRNADDLRPDDSTHKVRQQRRIKHPRRISRVGR